MQNKPFFSVIIPTRNRPQTLLYCIKSCLAQKFENTEFLVSDNSDTSIFSELESFASDARLRYIRTPKIFPMHLNWEYALNNAKGEYIIYIGDDDGLLRHCLCDLNDVIQKTDEQIIRWNRVHYSWGNDPRQNCQNSLSIPLPKKIERMNSRKTLRDVLNLQTDYDNLPMLYNSAIASKLLKKYQTENGGFFKSLSPDVWSGMLIALNSRTFLTLDRPMTINGASGFSNGLDFTLNHKAQSSKSEFLKLAEENNTRIPECIPSLGTIEVAIHETVYKLKQLYSNESKILNLNHKKYFEKYIIAAFRNTKEVRDEWLSKIKQAGSVIGLDDCWINGTFSKIEKSTKLSNNAKKMLGVWGNNLKIDASCFGVSDVNGAATLVENIMNYSQNKLKIPKNSSRSSLYDKIIRNTKWASKKFDFNPVA